MYVHEKIFSDGTKVRIHTLGNSTLDKDLEGSLVESENILKAHLLSKYPNWNPKSFDNPTYYEILLRPSSSLDKQ